MPTYTTNYRITFQTFSYGSVTAKEVTIDIEDRFSPDGTPSYEILEGAGTPLLIETINNSGDPLHPILATSVRMQFLSTATVNSSTFSQGTDNRFFVRAYTDSEVLFVGFMLMDDIEERFVNPAFGNVVTLTATDNIGTLKEQEYSIEIAGEPVPDGHYLAMAPLIFPLKKTGLELNLNIVWNVFEQDFDTDDSPLNQLYLWTLTFEKEATTKEDCYTVLQKMAAGLRARLFQYNGEWWIVRLHEYRTALDTLHRITYDADGVLVNAFADVSILSDIAGGNSNNGLFLINADATITGQREHKFDQDSYSFETPKEVPTNKDFIRGAFLSGTNPKLFEVDSWTLEKQGGGTPDISAYIRRTYDSNNQEDSRFVVMTGGVNEHFLRSEPVPVHQRDKFNLEFSYRFSGNLTGTSGPYKIALGMVRLVGDDGTYWVLNGDPLFAPIGWVESNASFTIVRYLANTWDITQVNEEQDWASISVEAPPLPVSGDLYILLRPQDYNTSFDTYFSDLQFEYIPYINGTYAKYSGQRHKVTQAEAYKANRQDEVSISDSPKRLFKGAFEKYVGGRHVLTEDWTDGFDSGASGTGPLRKILTYDVWNQYKDPRTIIRGTVRGPMPAFSFLLNKFTFSDYSASKRFICLSEEVDVKHLSMTGEFMEVFDTEKPNDYTTDHSFSYEQ